MNNQGGLPELPKQWIWTRLEDLCSDITKGSTPTSYGFVYKPTGINFVKTENLQKDGNISDVTDHIDRETNVFLKRSMLQPDDLLFSIAGTIGRVGFVKDKNLPANTNQALAIVRLFRKHLTPKFLFYYLRSPQIQTKALSSIVGVGRANVSLTNLGSFPVPLASRVEQDRIVAKIEELFTQLDAGIEELRKARAQLKRYRQAVLKAAVTGELTKEWREAHKDELEPASELLARILKERRAKWETHQIAKMKDAGKTPNNDEWKKKYVEATEPDAKELPNLPNKWAWASVDQLTEIVTKGSSPNWQGFHYVDEGITFVRSQNVIWGALDLTESAYLPKAFNKKEKKSILKTDDVLLNIVGASIGRAAVATKAVDGGNVNQAVAVIRLLKSGFAPKLLAQFLISPDAQRRINTEKVDVARANLSLEDVKSLTVPLMSLGEQETITAETERLLSIADAIEQLIEQNLTQSERMRQSILKRAFEGRLVPQDPNDEPAEVLLERIKAERAEREAQKHAASKLNQPRSRKNTKRKRTNRVGLSANGSSNS